MIEYDLTDGEKQDIMKLRIENMRSIDRYKDVIISEPGDTSKLLLDTLQEFLN